MNNKDKQDHEAAQRARIAETFGNRKPSPATGDFDLPAAGDVVDQTQADNSPIHENSANGMTALFAIQDRIELIERQCRSLAPKQAIGELLAVTLNMPEWGIARAAVCSVPITMDADRIAELTKELESTKRMFVASCEEISSINEQLGLDRNNVDAGKIADTILGWHAALLFYAEGCHFHIHDESAWDTVSGEPLNFYEDESSTATVEDGSVAKAALSGTTLGDDDAPQPAAAPVALTAAQISAGARWMSDHSAEVCNVNKDDNWKAYGQSFIDEFRSAILAAGAAVSTDSQDAVRYRYLRDEACKRKPGLHDGGRAAIMIGNNGEALDKAVDAVILAAGLSVPVVSTDAQDAARYRGLRETCSMSYGSGEGSESKDAYLTVTGYDYERINEVIDAAVDAALLAAKGGA